MPGSVSVVVATAFASAGAASKASSLVISSTSRTRGCGWRARTRHPVALAQAWTATSTRTLVRKFYHEFDTAVVRTFVAVLTERLVRHHIEEPQATRAVRGARVSLRFPCISATLTPWFAIRALDP